MTKDAVRTAPKRRFVVEVEQPLVESRGEPADVTSHFGVKTGGTIAAELERFEVRQEAVTNSGFQETMLDEFEEPALIAHRNLDDGQLLEISQLGQDGLLDELRGNVGGAIGKVADVFQLETVDFQAFEGEMVGDDVDDVLHAGEDEGEVDERFGGPEFGDFLVLEGHGASSPLFGAVEDDVLEARQLRVAAELLRGEVVE